MLTRWGEVEIAKYFYYPYDLFVVQVKLITLLFVILLVAGGFFYYQTVNSDEYQINKAIERKLVINGSIKSFTVSDLKVKDDFARVQVTSPDLDPAGMILQKKDGNWQVIWGPSTGTGVDDPIFKIIPKDF